VILSQEKREAKERKRKKPQSAECKRGAAKRRKRDLYNEEKEKEERGMCEDKRVVQKRRERNSELREECPERNAEAEVLSGPRF